MTPEERAAFWIGDPRNLKDRRLLGVVAGYGTPLAVDIQLLADARSEADMERLVKVIADFRSTALVPSIDIPPRLLSTFVAASNLFRIDGKSKLPPFSPVWEFPWMKSIFNIDFTYAWFNGELHATIHNRALRPFRSVAALCRIKDFAAARREASRIFGPVRLDVTPPPKTDRRFFGTNFAFHAE